MQPGNSPLPQMPSAPSFERPAPPPSLPENFMADLISKYGGLAGQRGSNDPMRGQLMQDAAAAANQGANAQRPDKSWIDIITQGGGGRASFDAPNYQQPKPAPFRPGGIADLQNLPFVPYGNNPRIPKQPKQNAVNMANQGANKAGGMQRVSPGVYRNAKGGLVQSKAGK